MKEDCRQQPDRGAAQMRPADADHQYDEPDDHQHDEAHLVEPGIVLPQNSADRHAERKQTSCDESTPVDDQADQHHDRHDDDDGRRLRVTASVNVGENVAVLAELKHECQQVRRVEQRRRGREMQPEGNVRAACHALGIAEIEIHRNRECPECRRKHDANRRQRVGKHHVRRARHQPHDVEDCRQQQRKQRKKQHCQRQRHAVAPIKQGKERRQRKRHHHPVHHDRSAIVGRTEIDHRDGDYPLRQRDGQRNCRKRQPLAAHQDFGKDDNRRQRPEEARKPP